MNFGALQREKGASSTAIAATHATTTPYFLPRTETSRCRPYASTPPSSAGNMHSTRNSCAASVCGVPTVLTIENQLVS